jgi:hypothetical protein
MGKSKAGRKPWKPTLHHIAEVERMAAMGMNQSDIAYNLGIHIDTFINKKKEFSEFSEAIQRGRARGTRYVTSQLMKNIEAGNFQAQKYWLSVHSGWKEVQVTELTGSDGQAVQHEVKISETGFEIQNRISDLLNK